ncbi:MAG: PD40 domain-containing protein [Armatimonadetes bacterium]|nr:PD40 domain-containing protein [Armatimonadota bacterium]
MVPMVHQRALCVGRLLRVGMVVAALGAVIAVSPTSGADETARPVASALATMLDSRCAPDPGPSGVTCTEATPDRLTYRLPPEDNAMVGDGLLATGTGTAKLELRPQYVSDLVVGSTVVVPPRSRAARGEARAAMTDFVVRNYGHLFSEDATLELSQPLIDVDLDGCWRFIWVAPSGPKPTLYVRADVRPYDGKLVALAARYRPDFWQTEGGVSPGEAVSAALQVAKESVPDAPHPVVTSIYWDDPRIDGATRRIYLVGLALGAAPARPYRTTVFVDSLSGDPLSRQFALHRRREYDAWGVDWSVTQARSPVADRWPSWTRYGMLYISLRRPADVPAEQPVAPLLLLAGPSDTPKYVTLNAVNGVSLADADYDVCAAVFDDGSGALLDLANGTHAPIASSKRPILDVAVDRAGLLAYSAHRRHGDEDIFTREWHTEDGLSAGRENRALRLDGLDARPLLDQGRHSVLFAHWLPRPAAASELPNWEVLRVDLAERGPAVPAPERVIGGLGEVSRMSRFPDGRLLVWHGGGLDIVDPEAKTKEPLDLPPLRDPELPAARPALKLRDPAVSPDGKLLAFSGYRDSGDPEHGTGWYIYTCNLDGSDVKRITPLEDDPVEPYVFPETGKTAFDVAREIAEQQKDQQEGE